MITLGGDLLYIQSRLNEIDNYTYDCSKNGKTYKDKYDIMNLMYDFSIYFRLF
jgi:hypothetical protein